MKRWRLFTDVEDDALLEWLSTATAEATRQFQLAWKFEFPAHPASAVLLFADASRARSFDPRACGRFGTNVVSVAPVPGDPAATRSAVLHQLGHLYALDLLGDPAPPWLEEGIADAFAAVGERGSGFQTALPRVPTGPDGRVPVPPSMSELLGSGPELFADDERGAALRHEARRLARYFWNCDLRSRWARFRAFVRGDGPERRSFSIETFLTKTRTNLPELQRSVRSFREPPPIHFPRERLFG